MLAARTGPVLLFAIIAAGLAGCGGTPAPTTQPSLAEAPPTSAEQPGGWRQLRTAPVPFAYVVPDAGLVRLTDTEGTVLVDNVPVDAETLVMADPTIGVTIGKQRVAPGPLGARRYIVWWKYR